jgi:peptide chain release factor subunit 1
VGYDEKQSNQSEVTMLGRGVLSSLHTLTQQKTNTLTLYLDIDQNKQSNRKRGFVVQAEALLKDLRSRSGRSPRFDTAAEIATDLVRKLRPTGMAALVVVHPETDLREVQQINLPFAASAHWQKGAFLRPIVEAMDEHERYGVVLTDTKRARLFLVHMGELTEHEDLFSETARRTKAVGSDQWRAGKRHDRRHDGEVASHAKKVIDALHDLSLRAPFDRLIVAGTPKATSRLVRLLPKRLRGKLIGTVSMSVGAAQKEVLTKILNVQRKMEREQESLLVEGVLAELHDGGKAVAEFPGVLDAVNQGRVWKLVYAKGLKKVGGECADCNAYTPEPTGICAYCGGEVQGLTRFVDRLSQTVMEMGGQVEMVDGPAAEHLKPKGSIAALLRY